MRRRSPRRAFAPSYGRRRRIPCSIACGPMSLVSVTDAFGSVVMSALSSSEGGGVEVDFDLTVVGQIVLFLFLFIVLKPMLFDPMLHLFEERERRIDGAKLLARKIDEKSAGALTTYETE